MQQIFVRDLDGKTLVFDVKKSITSVNDLKYEIWRRNGLPPPAQRLIYRGRQLNDRELLPEKPEATLHLLGRMAPQVYIYLAKQNRWMSENLYTESTPQRAEDARARFAHLLDIDVENVVCAPNWLERYVSVIVVQQ